jgi:hypothetical protein
MEGISSRGLVNRYDAWFNSDSLVAVFLAHEATGPDDAAEFYSRVKTHARWKKIAFTQERGKVQVERIVEPTQPFAAGDDVWVKGRIIEVNGDQAAVEVGDTVYWYSPEELKRT